MEDKEGLEQPTEPKGDEAGGRILSRKNFVVGAGAAGAALFLGQGSASARAWSSAKYNRVLGKLALSPGMIGGPRDSPGQSATGSRPTRPRDARRSR